MPPHTPMEGRGGDIEEFIMENGGVWGGYMKRVAFCVDHISPLTPISSHDQKLTPRSFFCLELWKFLVTVFYTRTLSCTRTLSVYVEL